MRLLRRTSPLTNGLPAGLQGVGDGDGEDEGEVVGEGERDGDGDLEGDADWDGDADFEGLCESEFDGSSDGDDWTCEGT